VKGDFNFWAHTAVTEEVLAALGQAKVVIWPQVFTKELYFYSQNIGLLLFPDYRVRFMFPGKGGQFLLFKALGLPCPKTIYVPKIAAFGPHPATAKIDLPAFPFVLKSDAEHEGRGVFLVRDDRDFNNGLSYIKCREREGSFGFLIQEYIASPYDLRVVVFGKNFYPFWRACEDDFRTNLVQGGRKIPCPDANLEEKALQITAILCEKTGTNLAAIDFLIDERRGPLLNEINFVFGRRLLGQKYEEFFFKAVKEFLADLS